MLVFVLLVRVWCMCLLAMRVTYGVMLYGVSLFLLIKNRLLCVCVCVKMCVRCVYVACYVVVWFVVSAVLYVFEWVSMYVFSCFIVM